MKSGTTADGMRGDISRQATAWLVQLEDAPENDALRAEFIDWLTTSPAHLAAWEETARVSDLIAAAGPLPRRTISVLPIASGPRGWFRNIRPASTLASLTVAACLAWVAVPYLALRLQSDAMTGTGELRLVKLEDGSTVELAPTTAIAFTNEAAGRRLSLLQGEAWFDVAHDKERPFRVMAGDSSVTVLGTAFSVRLTDAGTDVAVQRGRVAVTSDRARSDRVELVAGQSLTVVEGEAIRGAIRPDRVASWRDGVAIVNDLPIGDVIDRIRPWYGGYIIAKGPGLRDRRVSGIYDLHDPDLALKALTRAHKVTVSQVSPWLRIVTVG
ncbi:FecR family protein [Novosphingobium sp. CF614]|uniref:FecR family protein n=1 Tax=Novosphingobium sp. CF614 TaxID=1884364 RepID=UPI0008F34ADD|nr:FecR family protein [Novosphingobium sp. CF614]SFG34286.1 FecR family protein [Novosphingobium sp. CF614]